MGVVRLYVMCKSCKKILDNFKKERDMANKEHIEWLLEGVEAWNKRREQEYFQPDFTKVNISSELKKKSEPKKTRSFHFSDF